MRTAATAGADLVEFDIAHPRRTTDVATVFPGREADPVGSFTLAAQDIWLRTRDLATGSVTEAGSKRASTAPVP